MPHNKRHIINMIYSYQVLFIFSHNSSAAFNSRGVPRWNQSALIVITGTSSCGDQKRFTFSTSRLSPEIRIIAGLRVSTCSRLTCGQGTGLSANTFLPRHSVTTSLCRVVPDAVKIGFWPNWRKIRFSGLSP